jgi:hypothetical protein
MEMKVATFSVVVASVFLFAQSAQARENHRHHVIRQANSHHYTHHYGHRYFARIEADHSERNYVYSEQTAYGGGLGNRPRAWCGWQMRQLVGSDPGPSFNLARNWTRWGHPGPAGVGAVVVWSHHVGKIVGQEGGQWIIQSGNDGRTVRTRPRSIVGAIAIRWR